MSLQEWNDAVCAELDIDPDYELRAVLDAARDVAHAVERPAAPLTAFLAGYAAARAGGSADDIVRTLERVTGLAAGWSPPS